MNRAIVSVLGLVVGLAALQGCQAEDAAAIEAADESEVKSATQLCRPGVDYPEAPLFDGKSPLKTASGKVDAARTSIDLGRVADGPVHLWVTKDGNSLPVSKKDFDVCGKTMNLRLPLHLDLRTSEGLSDDELKACARDLSNPACATLATYCAPGSGKIGAHGFTCEVMAGVELRAEVYERDECTVEGEYCGADKIVGEPNVLYRCLGGKKTSSVESCNHGCEQVPGKNDRCKKTGEPEFADGPEGAMDRYARKEWKVGGAACDTAKPGEKRVCWSLIKEREGEKLYSVGDPFSEFWGRLHVVRKENGEWFVKKEFSDSPNKPFTPNPF